MKAVVTKQVRATTKRGSSNLHEHAGDVGAHRCAQEKPYLVARRRRRTVIGGFGLRLPITNTLLLHLHAQCPRVRVCAFVCWCRSVARRAHRADVARVVAWRAGRWHTAGALLWCACRRCACVRARAGRGHAVCSALRRAVCGVCVPCPSNARPVGVRVTRWMSGRRTVVSVAFA